MVKRRLKIRPVLVTLNVLVLLIIVGFYSFRMIKYYKIENGSKNKEMNLLVDTIIRKQSYVDLTKGLVLDDKTNEYYYIGDVKDNYLNYSGNIYRIISIDTSNNIKAVSEKSLTYIYSGLEKGFLNSYVNKWLNLNSDKNSGIFENNLYGSEVLFNTSICEDVVDDVTNITCENKSNDNKIGILSLYDYAKSGGKSGYLNNGEDFFLNTLNSDNNIYYITSDGDVSKTELTTKILGVRPVITISGDTLLLDGNGKENSPYQIEKHDINTIKDLYVGNIIEFSDEKYIVIDVSSDNVKVAKVDSLKENDEDLLKQFGGYNSSYDAGKNTIGYYLNNDYYKSLKNNELIVKSKWNTGKLSLDNLDYSSTYSNNVSLYIGMPNIGDMYLNSVANVFTLIRGIEDEKMIYVINKDGNLYGDFISSKYAIRPVFYLKGDISIVSGDGNYDSPYILGVNHGEEN